MQPNTRARLLLVLLASGIPVLPALAAEQYPRSVAKLISAAKRAVPTVDMHAFKQVVVHPGKALIIDVREPAEYLAGHVPGAINIPRGLLEFKLWPHVGGASHPDYDRTIYVYCGVGSRAALAAQRLKRLGFRHVTAVEMRIEAWDAAGYPLDFQ